MKKHKPSNLVLLRPCETVPRLTETVTTNTFSAQIPNWTPSPHQLRISEPTCMMQFVYLYIITQELGPERRTPHLGFHIPTLMLEAGTSLLPCSPFNWVHPPQLVSCLRTIHHVVIKHPVLLACLQCNATGK